MPYGIKVEFDGSDITDKVSRLEITAALDSYVREASVEIADEDLFDSINFGRIPDAPQLEIYTRVESSWVSQGKFYVERPTHQVGIHSTTTGIWGRSETARLGAPFAPKVRKVWDRQTSLYRICEEMCELAGLAWSSAYSDIPDFTVYAYTFEAAGLYPCEVISELLELAYGEDAYLTTDRSGHVCLRKIDRTPSGPTATVTDPVTVGITEEPEWPEFGNRVRISAAGSVGGYNVEVETPIQCLAADGETRAKLYARVTDQDGLPLDDVPVSWTAKAGLVTLDRDVTNTRTIRIPLEEQRATSFTTVDLEYPPENIVGIWAYKDVTRRHNLAEAGYTIDGRTVTLTERLRYCDQLLRITYTCRGVAVNWATAKTAVGNEEITAELAGNSGSIELYLGNPCQCPPSITLRANPTSIEIGSAARLLTYVEIAGAPVRDGRIVYNTIDSTPAHGHIEWTRRGLGNVGVENEETSAINEVTGVTQCKLSMHPASVTGVWRAVEDSEGNLEKAGGNLYGSHQGKLVNLTGSLTTGTELLADYTAIGGAVNVYDGMAAGTDRIKAILVTASEARAEADTTITVTETGGGGEDDPPDCCNDGLCDAEEIPCDESNVQCTVDQVYAMKAGVAGCWTPEEADKCGDGKIYCFKLGALGCFLVAECDKQAKVADRIRCKSSGTDGCWPATECDSCTETGEDPEDPDQVSRVYCYKQGVFGCYPVEECDKGVGGGGQVLCPPGTVCCEDAVTGKRGCWEPARCRTGPNDGRPRSDDKWDNKPGGDCHKADGTVKKCGSGEACCSKGGVRDCWPWKDCDKSPDYCYSTDCRQNPSPNCLQTRFAQGMALEGADGCSCEEMCRKEFEKYGTTQNYNEGSYVPVVDLVRQQYGTPFGTPEFWEKYEEIKEDAVKSCRDQCTPCEQAGALALSGSDAVTSPGGYQYGASGGLGPYQWAVAGTGAVIDQTGYVTLSEEACGSFSVTVQDRCGQVKSMSARVTNNGAWVSVTECDGVPAYTRNPPCQGTPLTGSCTKGKCMYEWGFGCGDIPGPDPCNARGDPDSYCKAVGYDAATSCGVTVKEWKCSGG